MTEITKTERFNIEAKAIKRNMVLRLRQSYAYLDMSLFSLEMFNQAQKGAKSEALYLITMLAVKYDVSLFSQLVQHQEKAIEHIMLNEGGC